MDTTLRTPGGAPLPRKDPALMTSQEVVHALRHTAVEHNIRLMHRLSREQLFVGTLEAARGEKDPARIRAYVAILRSTSPIGVSARKNRHWNFSMSCYCSRMVISAASPPT